MVRRFAAIAALVSDGLLLVSKEGRIVAANALAAERLCSTAEALTGTALEDHLADPPGHVADLLARCRRSTSPIPGTFTPRHGTGARERCDRARLPDDLVEGEALVLLRCATADDRFGLLTRKVEELNLEILERKQAQAQREALIEQLARTVRVTEMFMGIVGHDLRNPLAAISATASLGLRRGPPEAPRRDLERILTSAQRMSRMIEQLLDVTRIRLGNGLPVARAEMDLAEVARQAIAEAERANPDRRFVVDVRGATQGSWDHDRLAQVLSNLLGNAVQHGPPSSPVTLTLDGTARESVTLRVHNEGTPIPPDRLASLFDAFNAGDRSRGLGLGLYITREIVVAHGGSVDVASTAGGGTAFVITLPRAEPEAAPNRAA
ncbi:MAG: ATP-binding protein [Anaeromyxobacteraceae bacterium]